MPPTPTAPTPPSPPAPGLHAGRLVFARYRLEKVVGRGGMGVVWRAFDTKLERTVALKFLPDVFFMDVAARDDLKRETRRSLELTHPHIVRIHDFLEDEETAAISMEYVDGPTLSQRRVEQPSRFFECEALHGWAQSLCQALDYAHHTACCVHRDLKPSNLMVTGRGILKVADFGIACGLQNTAARVSSVTSTGGTYGYMSPQQLAGELAAPSDDIYSVGATLYELLTSKPPFFQGDLHYQIRTTQPDAIAERRRKLGLTGRAVDPLWEETILACLAKDPRERPADVLQLAQRLGVAVPGTLHAAPIPCESEATIVLRTQADTRGLDQRLSAPAPDALSAASPTLGEDDATIVLPVPPEEAAPAAGARPSGVSPQASPRATAPDPEHTLRMHEVWPHVRESVRPPVEHVGRLWQASLRPKLIQHRRPLAGLGVLLLLIAVWFRPHGHDSAASTAVPAAMPASHYALATPAAAPVVKPAPLPPAPVEAPSFAEDRSFLTPPSPVPETPAAASTTADRISPAAVPVPQENPAPVPTTVASTGQLEITTVPSGIAFRVIRGASEGPGEPEVLASGFTPAALENLPAGASRVELTAPGIGERSFAVRLSPDQPTKLDRTFPHGTVKFQSTPAGAEIYDGDQLLGNAPLETAVLPGEHAFHAEQGDEETKPKMLTVLVDATHSLSFDVRPAAAGKASNTVRRSRSRSRKPEPSTFSKIGTSISNFFTGGGDKKRR